MAKDEYDNSSKRRRRTSTKAAAKSAPQPRRLPPDVRRTETGSAGKPSPAATYVSVDQPKSLPRSSRRSRTAAKAAGGDYEVGYGKPPTGTQFKPGQSGNPKGRPKNQKSFNAYLFKALDEPVEVNENGKRKQMTRREVAARQIAIKAMKGDLKAMTYIRSLEPDDSITPQVDTPLSEHEMDLLNLMLGKSAEEDQ